MKALAIFLQFMGVIFLATVAHELYHMVGATVQEVGIRFGSDGGFFVQGWGMQGEPGAYAVTITVLALGTILILLANPKPTHE